MRNSPAPSGGQMQPLLPRIIPSECFCKIDDGAHRVAAEIGIRNQCAPNCADGVGPPRMPIGPKLAFDLSLNAAPVPVPRPHIDLTITHKNIVAKMLEAFVNAGAVKMQIKRPRRVNAKILAKSGCDALAL